MNLFSKFPSYYGVIIAFTIIILWLLSTTLAFFWPVHYSSPIMYLWILVQMQLYTGLFITAHDAMHGTVNTNPRINNFIGWTCTLCYALFFYSKLLNKHKEHHQFVHSEKDPDFSRQNFLIWYISFFIKYFSLLQYLLLNVLFFLLHSILKIPQANLILFWIAPSLLSSLQLFYFGTYIPHRGDPGNNHFARTQKKNHFLAFFSCYFFGYHFEHHNTPSIPWWRLYKQKS